MVNESWTVSGGKAFFGTPQFRARPAHNVEAGFFFGGYMSRSRKKHPITGITTAETDKPFKQQEHQRERSAVRDALKTEKEVLPSPREFGDPCKSMKDGKTVWTENQDKAKRK
jgi:hypothetical protein